MYFLSLHYRLHDVSCTIRVCQIQMLKMSVSIKHIAFYDIYLYIYIYIYIYIYHSSANLLLSCWCNGQDETLGGHPLCSFMAGFHYLAIFIHQGLNKWPIKQHSIACTGWCVRLLATLGLTAFPQICYDTGSHSCERQVPVSKFR